MSALGGVVDHMIIANLFNKKFRQFLDTEPNPGLTVKAGLTIKFASG
jgi:hypothetical protein